MRSTPRPARSSGNSTSCPRAPGDIERGPQARIAARRVDAGKTRRTSPITGGATWTSYTLDPGNRAALCARRQSRAGFRDAACAAATNLYSGSVVVLDARTGAYKSHIKLVPKDWHDWDVSSAPALIETAGGKSCCRWRPRTAISMASISATSALLYRMPVTRVENADATFSRRQVGAFLSRLDRRRRMERAGLRSADQSHPGRRSRLVHDGDAADAGRRSEATPRASPGLARPRINPFNTWGKPDPFGHWAGWVYASRCRHRRLEMAGEDQLSRSRAA